MLCGRISVESKAEEIAVTPTPRCRQKHGKRSNPYSTIGLDKFDRVYAELSAKRKYIANKNGVPEAMVRFVSSKKGWIPVVIGVREQGTEKQNSSVDDSGVSILGPAENNNGEIGRESKEKDEGNDINSESERRDLTVGAPISPVRAEGDPTEFWDTASLRVVDSKNVDLEHNNHHHHSEDKMCRRFVFMDDWPSYRPASPVLGSDSFYRKTKATVGYDASVGAVTVMIIMLFCFVFYGRLCAILFTSACLYLVAVFREGPGRTKAMNMNTNNGRMVHLRASANREMVDLGWIGKEQV